MKSRAFSMKSSRQATRKKSFSRTLTQEKKVRDQQCSLQALLTWKTLGLKLTFPELYFCKSPYSFALMKDVNCNPLPMAFSISLTSTVNLSPNTEQCLFLGISIPLHLWMRQSGCCYFIPQNAWLQTHLFTLSKFLLCSIKIKVHIKTFQELCDGISVSVWFLLDHFHQVLQHRPPPLVGDHCCRQVTQDVGTHGLDGIQVSRKKYIISFISKPQAYIVL